MVAEMMQSGPVEDIDLSGMTLDELRAESVACQGEIDRINEQLQDAQRVIDLGIGYPDWRRRARWALVCRKQEKREIGVAILQRQEEAAAARKARHEDRIRAMQERRDAAIAAIEDRGNVDGLLLRVKVVVQHLIGDGKEPPDSLTDGDLDALHDLSVYLRGRFTNDGVRYARRLMEGRQAAAEGGPDA